MNLLSITGSDPSSGAGIQSDIKTFSSLHVYALTVLTSITSQNTTSFSKIQPISSYMVESQLDSIFSDFMIDAIKIGVVYNSSIIKTINSKLKKINIPIIVDPIIQSTTGGVLLKEKSFSSYKKLIIPLSTVITPNLFEAEKLSGIKIKTVNDLYNCALYIKKLGAKNVIITGFKLKNKIVDYVLSNSTNYIIYGKNIVYVIHGTGCIYSSALAVYLAMGKNIYSSAVAAKKFVCNSITHSQKIGIGMNIATYNKPRHIEKLEKAILKLRTIKNIYLLIPECQTNFVYAKLNPKSIQCIIGITGRIVRSGNNILIAGGIEYGGSIHVATAVLEVTKKFSKLRSAINIKYDKKIIQTCKKKNYVVLSYDRTHEPTILKASENASISWGIKNSINDVDIAPDIIFHTGDIGKEPMILIFGNDPDDVVKKLGNIYLT